MYSEASLFIQQFIQHETLLTLKSEIHTVPQHLNGLAVSVCCLVNTVEDGVREGHKGDAAGCRVCMQPAGSYASPQHCSRTFRTPEAMLQAHSAFVGRVARLPGDFVTQAGGHTVNGAARSEPSQPCSSTITPAPPCAEECPAHVQRYCCRAARTLCDSLQHSQH
jgi:hypothetical protein